MDSLDGSFSIWLQEIASAWHISVAAVAHGLGDEEIYNRLDYYPVVRKLIADAPVDISALGVAMGKCWVLVGRFYSPRLNGFLTSEEAPRVLRDLLYDFPEDADESAERIDRFVGAAVDIGFAAPNGSRDYAGAAQLASVLLTCLDSSRFVDYRRSRWTFLAKRLCYPQPPSGGSYGADLIWAGQFARNLAETKTFKLYWPDEYALWVLAGICWVAKNPLRPEIESTDVEAAQEYSEGAEKWLQHLARERNQALVKAAKELGASRDPRLPCTVCGVSFAEEYGPLGSGFIEAHHQVPVATLKAGGRTRVKDLVLVCPNCHNMLHRGEHVLTVEELRVVRERARASVVLVP